MKGKRKGTGVAMDSEEEGSSQVDVRQKQERPARAPEVSCSVCHKEVDELKAMKSEARDEVTYFCDLRCFGEWERARSGR